MQTLKRTSIVFLWIFFIAAVLYLPHFSVTKEQQKSLNVFVWGDSLSQSILSEFEKKTGIKINLSFYATNEELQVKMQATDGVGYDLVMPSNYATTLLSKKGLLKELDHNRLTFLSKINPLLLDLPFDPNNRFSIPYSWEIYGLGYDQTFFSEFEPTWKAIYDRNRINYRVALQNDPIEAIALTALYLFDDLEGITPEKFAEIKALLFEQRDWVEAYSDFRAPYFIATGNCPVAVTSNSYIRRIHSSYPHIDFVLPKEGSFLSIENFCIPKASKKEKYAYKLLNYLYTKDSMRRHFDEFGFFPAFVLDYDKLAIFPYEKKLLEISPEEFQRLHFFRNLVPQQKARDLWVEVKSY